MFGRRRTELVHRDRSGNIVLSIPEHLRELTGQLLGELRELLVTDADSSLRRLYPTAYADNPELDDDYQRLMKDDLLEGRLAALDTVEATLHADRLDQAELEAWMACLNSLRLVLGTRLDVSEDSISIDEDDPEAPMFALYDVFTWMLAEIVEVLSEGIDPAGTDDNSS